MKNIGKYNGIPCYECTDKEYTNVVKSGQDNGKQIFIIDGTMVKKNEIVGYYDGKHVRDVYDGKVYYRNDDVMNFGKQAPEKITFTVQNSKWDEKFVEEVKARQARQEGKMTVASYEELVKQDIDFRRYSTVVDEFFALLER